MDNHYTRYWIKSGIEVVHVDHIAMKNPLVMVVDRLLKKSIKLSDGNRKNMVVGVMTHWWENSDDTPKLRTGRFNTKELRPLDIVKGGTAELIKWEEHINGK